MNIFQPEIKIHNMLAIVWLEYSFKSSFVYIQSNNDVRILEHYFESYFIARVRQ